MTLRELLFKLLDAGVDNLDSKVIFFQEGISSWGEGSAIEADFCDISVNGDCVQLFVHNMPFTDV